MPILLLRYINAVPELAYNTIAVFADDIAILAIVEDHEESARNLQISIYKINDWTKRWLTK